MVNNETLERKTYWYSRGYVPHFDSPIVPQLLTFRLIDSFPQSRLDEWAEEFARMTPSDATRIRKQRIEEYLDKGSGSAWLSRPDIAYLITNALLCFDGIRYTLHAWTIMPNHVHVLLTLESGESLARVLHTWKSFTANRANKLLGRTGPFWQREFFDRFIRDERHFQAAVNYIDLNPVKAGLCEAPIEWPFGSAYLLRNETTKV